MDFPVASAPYTPSLAVKQSSLSPGRASVLQVRLKDKVALLLQHCLPHPCTAASHTGLGCVSRIFCSWCKAHNPQSSCVSLVMPIPGRPAHEDLCRHPELLPGKFTNISKRLNKVLQKQKGRQNQEYQKLAYPSSLFQFLYFLYVASSSAKHTRRI